MRLVKIGDEYLNLDKVIRARLVGPDSLPPAVGTPTVRLTMDQGETIDYHGTSARTILAILDEMAGLGPPHGGTEPEPEPTGPEGEPSIGVAVDVETGELRPPRRQPRRRQSP
jgi:hypothetical protein